MFCLLFCSCCLVQIFDNFHYYHFLRRLIFIVFSSFTFSFIYFFYNTEPMCFSINNSCWMFNSALTSFAFFAILSLLDVSLNPEKDNRLNFTTIICSSVTSSGVARFSWPYWLPRKLLSYKATSHGQYRPHHNTLSLQSLSLLEKDSVWNAIITIFLFHFHLTHRRPSCFSNIHGFVAIDLSS